MKLATALATGLFSLLAAACATDATPDTGSLAREVGACGDVEVHVFGQLGTFDPDGGGTGGTDPGGGSDTGGTGEGGGDGIVTRTTVTIARPGHHVVVVSAVDSVNWNVVAQNGAIIDKVYAVGIGKQHVKAPLGVEVLEDSQVEGTGACGYAWPATADCDTKGLLYLAHLRTKFHPTTFHGCARASQWTVGANMVVTSDCDPAGEMPASNQSDFIARCAPEDNGDEDHCDGDRLLAPLTANPGAWQTHGSSGV